MGQMSKRKLVLEDGTEFIGEAFGSTDQCAGEVVCNTGMTGYQEMITDPSYYGNIAVMTYPTIGAYGVNRDDFESIMPAVEGLIVKELCDTPSNFRSEETLDDYMKRHQIPGISGIDTRMLTRLLRQKGAMRGIIMDVDEELNEEKLNKQEAEEEILKKVSIFKPYIIPGRGKRIVLVDLGMNQSIVHELTERGCHITVVPYHYTADDIRAYKPDGVMLSNGPGNPAIMEQTKRAVQTLIGKYPIFGIGLGHQILALAYGAKTKKLVMGNYGVNFPVKDVIEDKSWITTQSRSYYVDEASLAGTNLQITHRSLNDQTIEGLMHEADTVFSVQFNPQGAPGSNETNGLFDQFLKRIEIYQAKNGGYHHA